MWIMFAGASITNILYVVFGSARRSKWDMKPEEWEEAKKGIDKEKEDKKAAKQAKKDKKKAEKEGKAGKSSEG